ncbi:MAG TPA: carboxymuconolactone decarboxylase family protein [Mycobacterium sp.]|nr:carboxymuconolactone decarboxylase family protein [Mycobacterium sp.]HTX96179.1 carboxymuconolactone decarboxylase family protein [Mycobacterium sp.]
MTVQTDALGGRLPLTDPAALTEAQRDLFDLMMNTMVPWARQVPFQSTTADGRLIGPFNPALLNPQTATKFLELQFAEQLNTSLDERVRQVIVLTVGAIWHADYELYAHAAVACKAGLSESAIRTLVGGGVPDDLSDRERLAQRVTRQLCTDHRLDDRLYHEAEKTFGTLGLIDMTSLIGVYHGVCITLTMFAVPAPAPIVPDANE